MIHRKNSIPYWIDRRLTGLAGPDYDATISFGLPFEPEDSQYGKYRLITVQTLGNRLMPSPLGEATTALVPTAQDGVDCER